jgi:hypothetical protein
MPKKKHTTPLSNAANNKTKKYEGDTFSIHDLMDGVADPMYVEVCGETLDGVCNGDVLIVDRARVPQEGELIVWSNRRGNGYEVGYYYEDDSEAGDTILGVAAALLRRFHSQTSKRIATQKQTPHREGERVTELRQRLSRLERLPENEGERFKLETEIHRLENQSEEWPETIAA